MIRIQRGELVSVFRDRRTPDAQNETRTGALARRRKLPSRFLHLVGTGRLWVAKGQVTINTAEASAYPKSAEMVIRMRELDLSLQVAHLKSIGNVDDHAERQTWAFHALFLPVTKQLERLRELGLIDENANLNVPEEIDLDALLERDSMSFETVSRARFTFKVR